MRNLVLEEVLVVFWIRFWASFVLTKAMIRWPDRIRGLVRILISVFSALLVFFVWWALYRWVLLLQGYVVGAKVEILNFQMAGSYIYVDKFIGTVCGVSPRYGGMRRPILVQWNGAQHWYKINELRHTGEVDMGWLELKSR